MLSIIMTLFILMSGSILCTAVWKKKFEEVIPITCMSIIVILFIAGILGVLKAGVYIVIGIAMFLIIYAMIYVIKKDGYKEFLNRFCTPAFILFIISCFIFTILNVGRKAYSWDEFSHWMDIVKVMTFLDDFGTNPNSYSAFQSYLPGMALFEYFFQKIFAMFEVSRAYSEWRVYWAYQIFIISIFMPFLKWDKKEFEGKNLVVNFFLYGMMLLAPQFLYGIFSTVYIDVILGILTATAFARIYTEKNKDIWYVLYILLEIFMLVLMKDAGMLFAVFVAFVFIVDYLSVKEKNIWKTSVVVGTSILSALVPKILWKREMITSQAKVAFADSVNINYLIDILLGRDTTYRTQVVESYFKEFFVGHVQIAGSITISFFIMLIIETLSLWCLNFIYDKKEKQKSRSYNIIIFNALSIIYIIGLCVTYISNFAEHEAVNLASYERYLNIMFVSGWIFIILLIVNLLKEMHEKQLVFVIGLVAIQMIITPLNDTIDFALRRTANFTSGRMAWFQEVGNKVFAETESDAKIYIISQEDAGYQYWALRYTVRPNIAEQEMGSWSLGDPYYEGDIYTQKKTAEEWQQELINGYDYVVLLQLNDYFYEQYSNVFEDENKISAHCVYKVNKDTGLLEFCN